MEDNNIMTSPQGDSLPPDNIAVVSEEDSAKALNGEA